MFGKKFHRLIKKERKKKISYFLFVFISQLKSKSKFIKNEEFLNIGIIWLRDKRKYGIFDQKILTYILKNCENYKIMKLIHAKREVINKWYVKY